MVSPWMEQGSVLTFMKDHSPSSVYAVELLSGVIEGLCYLRRMNIVHGDLCGRNILVEMNEYGKPMAKLTDFGLAAFIESDLSIQSSTRSGSSRWMAPELLIVPSELSFRRTTASDIWAFGCVCCEIWTQGVVPFSHFPNETQIVLAFLEPKNVQMQTPYTQQPCGNLDTLMPDALWDLARLCWNYNAEERPTDELCETILKEVAQSDSPQSEGPRVVSAPSAASSSKGSQSPLSGENLGTSSVEVKGKRRALAQLSTPNKVIVRLGPLDLTNGPEEAFYDFFELLLGCVPRGGLSEPHKIERDNADHVHLFFTSTLEANSFVMTWTVHRFEPYLDCKVELVTD